MNKYVELSVKDLRAIHQADISLDGITVVSGINGCGKSTLSRLLYYLFRNANAFDELALARVNEQLYSYRSVLEQLRMAMYYSRNAIGSSARRNVPRHKFPPLTHLENARAFLESARSLCSEFLNMEESLQEEGKSILSQRLRYILQSTTKANNDKDFRKLLDTLLSRIADYVSKAEQEAIQRPYKLLRESIYDVFDADLSSNVTVKEYGETIFGGRISAIPLLHYIKKVAYIDTPMLIGMKPYSGQPAYWDELNTLLKQPPRRGYKRSINDIIKNEIIGGDAAYDEDNLIQGFIYTRKDGQSFDLQECATGIKSFAVLQLLLKNRFLDENTLLIIDEPEAHLHPQWIVEYARLIVLLHKRVGVKFFIASHSTDMVSAIRYIAEKEKCLPAVGFYVAEEEQDEKNKFLFHFKALGHDIEPIFESFNKSFEKLDLYANQEKM